MQRAEVVIAGGGAVGSATAYFLSSQPAFPGSIVVVEPDPTYAFAASARSAASIRQQFSTPLNISLSAFGMQFLRACRGDLADVGLVESTYLYLASAEGEEALRHNVEVQRRVGVDTRLYDAASLISCYPWINPAGIAAASDTASGEGWFDGYALLRALRLANERRGVRYVRDNVVSVLMEGANSVGGVRLGSGDTLRCRWLVNAAGTHSRAIAAEAGIDLPVFPRKRSVFVFTSPAPPLNCPLVIDPSGLWFRPEGDRFICGALPATDPTVEMDDFEVDHHQFDDIAWPALARRVPAFEALRVTSSWAGHYDYNVFDQNAFLGSCETVPNLILASGFSGHGLQHAPAVGRALAELIIFGEYRTIDVTPFSYARYMRSQPLREHNVI
ncbi:MAG TPA: FAD-binding oxidoreductase [Steroidobacteraceae bacterium]|jgi:glycine/D-amino acid oxidase-like deaminating enzyme